MRVDDSSEGNLWTSIRNFFSGKASDPIEDVIKEARDEQQLGADIALMLLNVLKLGRSQVREVMIPRTDIDCIEEDSSIVEVAQMIIESGHSRIPVYRKNKDLIIGIIHAKDLLPVLLQQGDAEAEPRQEEKEVTLQDLMRAPLFVPETKNVKSMLLEFQSKKIHLAIAIDEYGGTSGLITFEDVLEEIVGEIEDEYDVPKGEEITVLEDESCLVSGRTSLEDLREQLSIEITSEFVETIGGYLTEKAGRVPQIGEVFEINGYTFQVKDADNKQVQSIVVYPVPACKKETLS
jgi:magnesium and cobalt transporter